MGKNKNTKVVLKEEQIAQCHKLAGIGLTLDQIAAYMDVSTTTMDQIISRQPDVARAIEKGRSQGIGTIANTLFQQAQNGNLTAAIFFLKTRGRWAEARDMGIAEDQVTSEFSLNYKK